MKIRLRPYWTREDGMISIVCGKPRGGKSYYAVLQFCQELRTTKRYIATNLPLDMEAVAEWASEYDISAAEVKRRVRILSDEETYEFWRHDPSGDITGFVNLGGQVKDGVAQRVELVPDLSHCQREDYPGCLWIIDESHVFFNARRTLKRSDELTYVMSQHGHLRWDIIFISQHPAKLDKHIRLDAQDYTVCQNLGNERGLWGVSTPGWFRRYTYQDMPSPLEKPETGTYRLQPKKFGKLYSTSAGVGLAGRVDTQEKKRGRHWSVWVVGMGAILIAGVTLPIMALAGMGKLVHKGLGSYLDAAAGGTVAVVSNAPVALSVPVAPPSPAAPASARHLRDVMPRDEKPEVYISGLTAWGVCLTDGRVLLKSDGYRWLQMPEGVFVEGVGLMKWQPKAEARPGPAGARGGSFAVVRPSF